MTPWWERFPGRLENELAWLTHYGIKAQVDEAQRTAGKIVLKIQHEVNGTTHHLVAFYPDTYPYTRFEVIAPDLQLPRHQNPFGHNLCLIGRSTLNWSTEDTVAKFLVEQFPKVLEIAATEDLEAIKDQEEPQGEPFSDFYDYEPHSALFIDSSWTIPPQAEQGTLDVFLDRSDGIRGVIASVSVDGKSVANADSRLVDRFRSGPRFVGRFFRWPKPIIENQPIAFIKELAHKFPKVNGVRQQTGRLTHPDVIGVIFPEEMEQGVVGDGWVFVVRWPGHPAVFVRASRAGIDDLAGRAPELRPLRDKHIALVGLGSLGSPACIEFAKAGVRRLQIIDYDFVEAGTVSRWALGLNAAGRKKTDAISTYLNANYPYSQVIAHWGAVGGALSPPGYSDRRVLDEIMSSDLIFDASAEVGIQHLLADLASAAGKPFVFISITVGAWGGMIARIRPGQGTGCYTCLQRAIFDGAIVPPLASQEPPVQMAGCASPTFTGAGFDCAAAAIAGVRMAIGTLCSIHEGGYPDVEWDVAVVNFRSADGKVVAPAWTTYSIPRYADCPSCGAPHAGVG